MTSSYFTHLILAGLVGVHCDIITVSEVSVKARGSISIPCLYEPSYRDHVKYLCLGEPWRSCKEVVKTNKPHSTGKFLIFDDKTRNIFTVTISDLTETNTYWCAVELKWKSDIGKSFQLSVTTDDPNLYVDKQEVKAFEGGSVTVVCRYNEDPKVTGWCRLGYSCVMNQAGVMDGTTVTINASVPKVFNVTMSELKTESSGWYWCTNGDFQVPVNVIVNESTSTTATSSTMISRTASALPTTTQHSSLLTSTHTAQVTTSTINGSGEDSLQDEHRSSTLMTILITTLVVLLLLLLLVPAAVLGWWLIRRGKTKPEGSDMTVDSQTGNDPDVHYSTIVHNQHVAAQKKQHHTPEDSVIYRTTVMRDSVQQVTEPADGSVIYSTLQ